MAYILAIAVGLSSFALYMAAFFLPELHRKYDFIWSGVGLFYALVLWVCAGRITGGVLLGQTASVALLGWFGWQTLLLRREMTPKRQRTLAGTNQTALQVVQANLQTMQRNLQAQWRSVMPFPAGSRPTRPMVERSATPTASATPSASGSSRPVGKPPRTARAERSPKPGMAPSPVATNPTVTDDLAPQHSQPSATTPITPVPSVAPIVSTVSPMAVSEATTAQPSEDTETQLSPVLQDAPDSASTSDPPVSDTLASDTPASDTPASDTPPQPAPTAPHALESDSVNSDPKLDPLESLPPVSKLAATPDDEAIAPPLNDRQNWADPFGDQDEILDAEFEEIGKSLSPQEQAMLARRTATDKRASRQTTLIGGLVSRIQSVFSKQRPPQTSPLPLADETAEQIPSVTDNAVDSRVDDDDTWPADVDGARASEPTADSALETTPTDAVLTDAADINWDFDEDESDQADVSIPAPAIAPDLSPDSIAEPAPELDTEKSGAGEREATAALEADEFIQIETPEAIALPNEDHPIEGSFLEDSSAEDSSSEDSSSEDSPAENSSSEDSPAESSPTESSPTGNNIIHDNTIHDSANEDSNWDLDEIFGDDTTAEAAIAPGLETVETSLLPDQPAQTEPGDGDNLADLDPAYLDLANLDIEEIFGDDDDTIAAPAPLPDNSSAEPSPVATEVEALPPEDTDWDVDEIFADETPLSDDHAIAPETVDVEAQDVSEHWAEPSEWLDRAQDSSPSLDAAPSPESPESSDRLTPPPHTTDEQAVPHDMAAPEARSPSDPPARHHDPAPFPQTTPADLTGMRRTYSSEPHFNDDDEDWF